MIRRTGLLPDIALPFRKMAWIISRARTTPAGSEQALPDIDSRTFRRAMGQFATGVTVIASDGPDGPHCMTANAVTSVSLDPPLILVCVGREARLSRCLGPGQSFTVNILTAEQEPLARYFSRTWPESEPPPRYQLHNLHGSHALAGCITALICDVHHRYRGGDHHIVLGRVRGISRPNPNRAPLLFHRGKYVTLSNTDDEQYMDMQGMQRLDDTPAGLGIRPRVVVNRR